jgi:hypothetical protein
MSLLLLEEEELIADNLRSEYHQRLAYVDGFVFVLNSAYHVDYGF